MGNRAVVSDSDGSAGPAPIDETPRLVKGRYPEDSSHRTTASPSVCDVLASVLRSTLTLDPMPRELRPRNRFRLRLSRIHMRGPVRSIPPPSALAVHLRSSPDSAFRHHLPLLVLLQSRLADAAALITRCAAPS